MALFEISKEAQDALDQAEREAKHATDELERISKGGTLDEQRIMGIRSELLSAALALTAAIDDEDNYSNTIEALEEVAEHGPGYPI